MLIAKFSLRKNEDAIGIGENIFYFMTVWDRIHLVLLVNLPKTLSQVLLKTWKTTLTS